MGHAIEELAHFIAGTPWEGIPKSVREHAKLVLLDTVGVIRSSGEVSRAGGCDAQAQRRLSRGGARRATR